MSVAISLRIPSELEKALNQLTAATERSKTYIICKAIETYLREYADYQIAVDRLRDKDDAIVTGTELRKRLAS